MKVIRLAAHDDFDGWRNAAREALAEGLPSDQLLFEQSGERSLFGNGTEGAVAAFQPITQPSVPKAFIDLARQVVCHTEPERFNLLYRILVRLQTDRNLMAKGTDPDVHRANVLAKEIRRDAHKMKAFVRFRKTGETADGTEQFVAWFEPTHHIVRFGAPFFMRRFAGMIWSILTPKGCAHWDLQDLTFTGPVPKSEAPEDDALEDYWRSYYASIFNPARLKTDAMRAEMPKKYWKNLPEAALIPGLVAKARERETAMRDSAPTEPKAAMMAHLAPSGIDAFPDREDITSLETLREALKGCRACPLWEPATQVVPGKGPRQTPIMFVGEQPGDKEDLAGEPFIGPAGQELRQAMADIGEDMDETYVTNAVKHFKFTPRGKRRIHQNPSTGEIEVCKWWLKREIELVQPRVVVALGGSAVRALTGRTQTIKSLRGATHPLEIVPDMPLSMVVANHPSYILRLPNDEIKAQARSALREDLQRAFALVA